MVCGFSVFYNCTGHPVFGFDCVPSSMEIPCPAEAWNTLQLGDRCTQILCTNGLNTWVLTATNWRSYSYETAASVASGLASTGRAAVASIAASSGVGKWPENHENEILYIISIS